MNERMFKTKLRRLLKPHCHIQGLQSMSSSGTPDLFLSGPTGCLFLEVKFDDVTKGPVKPKLTALQVKWLNGRASEGRRCGVILGTSHLEGIYYASPADWSGHSSERQPIDDLVTRILSEVL